MSIRSAFEFSRWKAMAPARAQGLSPSELQTVRTAYAYDPIFHIACLFMAND